MKCVTFDGLGEYLFYDVRHEEDGSLKDHPLNDAKYEGASILLSGINFGCGSSREHAPQAIYRAGFRAVIAQSFAEIFFGNCATLGVPCVTASAEDIETLARLFGLVADKDNARLLEFRLRILLLIVLPSANSWTMTRPSAS